MHFTSKGIAVEFENFTPALMNCLLSFFMQICMKNMNKLLRASLKKKWIAVLTIVLALCQSGNAIFTAIIKRVMRKIGHYEER